MTAKMPSQHRAFSLLEILVTAAIVAILFVLGIGGYQRIISAAQGTQNLANHRTIARGLLAYSQDYQGQLPWSVDYYPPFGNDSSSYPNSYSPFPKTISILGYVSDGSVFFSPRFWPRWANKATIQMIVKNPENYPSVVIPWAYTNYGANRYGAMPVYSDSPSRRPANLLRVGGDGNLSKLMLTRDTYSAAYDKAPSMLRGGGIHWFTNESNLPEPKDCYGGIVHASFADGHAEGFSREAMVDMMRAGSAAPLFNNIYTTQ